MVISFMRCFIDVLCGRRCKRGDMGIEEIMKIAIVLILVVVMLFAISILFFGKGGDILLAVRNTWRFGG